MAIITRKLEFDAGHRVLGHEGKCAHLHGHRYVAEITARAKELDSLGRVIDFSVIKRVVGKFIDDQWDHGFLINRADYELCAYFRDLEIRKGEYQKYFKFDGNPTAENIAKVLLETARGLLADTGIEVIKVRIYETPNCWADAE